MKTIVTGGAGFIGSNLVDELINLGHEVLVIDDFSLGKEENLIQHKLNPAMTILKKSICFVDKSDLEGFDVLFHLAALPRVQFSIANPLKTHEVNVNGTLNLLKACSDAKIKRFVYTSSSSVYGDQPTSPYVETMNPNPMSPYALHKLVGEYYCKLFNDIFGLKTIGLRYFNVYGPRQSAEGGYACLIPKFIASFKSDSAPVIFGDGEQTRDFTFVSDVVNANILAATTGNESCFGQVFNVGAGNSKSVNEVTKIIKELTNSSIDAKHGSGVIEPKHTLADISKSKNLLDWNPKVSFGEGIKKTVEFF